MEIQYGVCALHAEELRLETAATVV